MLTRSNLVALAALALLAPRASALAASHLPASDVEPPVARVVFPLPSALTDVGQVVVRGTASDASGVAFVLVDGVAAVSADGFRTWFATVPLHVGPNRLVVTTGDVLGNVDPAAAATVVRRDGIFLHAPSQIVYDAARRRCYVSELQLPVKLLEIDPLTGAVAVLSSKSVGAGAALGIPTEMALDPHRPRLIVNDTLHDSLLAVDLASGDRTVLSGPGVGSGPGLVLPDGLALGAQGRLAYVIDDGTETLVEIDLASGDRRVVSGPSVGGGPPLDYAWGLDLLPDGNRALVSAPFDHALMLVDVVTGERRIVSDEQIGQGPPLGHPFGVVRRPGSGAVTADGTTGALLLVDLASGDRVELAYSGHPLGGPKYVQGLTLGPGGADVLVVDLGWAAVLAVDLASGATRLVARNAIGAGPGLRRTEGLVLDPSLPGRALVVDVELDAVLSVDLASGRRAVLSGAGVGTGPAFAGPVDLVVDPRATPPRLLVLDDQPGTLFAVDLKSGDRTIVSGGGAGADVSSGGPFTNPQGVAIDPDPAQHRALVMDTYDAELVAVDLASGDRTTVSGVGVGSGPTLFPAYDLDVDGTRALVVNFWETTVLSVDLASGDRTLLSGPGVGSGPALDTPYEVVHDAQGGRSLVYDKGRVLAVDDLTGDRTLVAGYQPRRGPGPGDARGLALWTPTPGLPPLLLFADASYGAIGVLDLAPHPFEPELERQRTLVSR